MTTVSTMPNMEALITAVLADDLGIGVHSGLPKSPDYSAGVVTVARVGGSHPLSKRLDAPNIQLSCWGSTKVIAFNTAQAARTAAHLMEGQVYRTSDGWPVDAVVGEVEDTLGLTWFPDPTTNGEIDRYILSVSLVCHAL